MAFIWGDHLTVSVEVPSDNLRYNSQAPIQKIVTSHSGLKEIYVFKVYNGVANKLMNGNFQIRFKKLKEGLSVPLIDKSTAQFNHQWHSTNIDWISGSIRWEVGF